MRRILILVVTILWFLPIDMSFAAKDCFDVEDAIQNLSEKRALKKTKTQIRLHLKDLKKEGSEYEGQYHIACLIGLYMTIGEPTGADTLARFSQLSDWTSNLLGDKQSAKKFMTGVWRYKFDSDITDQWREVGYQNSEWVILALAKNVKDIVSVKLPTYPVDRIKDFVWCNKAKKSRQDLDQNIIRVSDVNNWQDLSSGNYVKAIGNLKAHSADLRALCGKAGSISSGNLKQLKGEYKKQAESLASNFWKTLISQGHAGEAAWEHFDWLKLKCRRGPVEREKNVISDVLEYKKILNSTDWSSSADKELISASNENKMKLRTVADDMPGCRSKLKVQLKILEDGIYQANKNHRRNIAKDIQRNWGNLLSGVSDSRLERHVKNNTTHIQKVFKKIPASCIGPTSNDKKHVQDVVNLKRAQGVSEILFLSAENAYVIIKDRFESCQQDTILENSFSEFLENLDVLLGNYKLKAKRQALIAWAVLIKTQGQNYESKSERLNIICGNCAPDKNDANIVRYLTRSSTESELKFSAEQFDRFRTKISKLESMDRELFSNLQDIAHEKIVEWDKGVVERWKPLLDKYCVSRQLSASVSSMSLHSGCSYPAQDEIESLTSYCYLKELGKVVESEQTQEGPDKDSRQRIWDRERGEKESIVVALLSVPSVSRSLDSVIDIRPNNVDFAQVMTNPNNSISDAVVEILQPVDPISEEAFDEGFRDAGHLQRALDSVQENGIIQSLFKKRLKTCLSGKYYKKQLEKLEETREFYKEVYAQMCEEFGYKSNLVGDVACDIEHTLSNRAIVSSESRPKQRKGQADKDSQKQSIIPIIPINNDYEITWRSKGNDTISVDGQPEMNTSEHAITRHKEGDEIIVEIWGPDTKMFELKLPCCNRREITNSSPLIFKTDAVEFSTHKFEVWFDLTRGHKEKSESKTDCYAMFLDEVGRKDMEGYRLSRIQIPPFDEITQLVPGSKIYWGIYPILLGEQFGGFVIAYIGDNYVIFLPPIPKGIGMNLEKVVPNELEDNYPGMAIKSGRPYPFKCIVAN